MRLRTHLLGLTFDQIMDGDSFAAICNPEQRFLSNHEYSSVDVSSELKVIVAEFSPR